MKHEYETHLAMLIILDLMLEPGEKT